jgi:hypothetical protein
MPLSRPVPVKTRIRPPRRGRICLRAIAAVLACSALAAALAGTLASCSSQSSTDDALARLDAIAEDFLGKTKPRPRVPEWAGKS